MESQPQKEKIFYGAEAVLINQAERCVDSIEDMCQEFVQSKETMYEINKAIEHMSHIVLPSMEKFNNLEEEYRSYVSYIAGVDAGLGIEISNYMKSKVNNDYVLTKEQIAEWEKAINILKTQMIPRLEKEGLEDVVHELEGAIIQSEIKIAHDQPFSPGEFEKIP